MVLRMNKSRSSKDVKEIKVDYIDTPRGRVPTVEAIKNLAMTWNELLDIMNKNLDKIAKIFGEIKAMLSKLDLSIQRLDGKIDNLSRSILELKSISKEMSASLDEIKRVEKDVAGSDLTKEKAKSELKRIFE